MADEPREYLRAAQAAEVRGNRAEAAELLCKAAHLYKAGGKSSRALALYRHAQRLDPARKELADEIKRLEWLPDDGPRRGRVLDDTLEQEMKKVLEPLEAMAAAPDPESEISIAGEPDTTLPGARRDIVERGPTLADPSVSAWCSFCCKPSSEVGALVAGPAGAFVCASCLAEAAKLLNKDLPLPSGEGQGVRAPEPAQPAGGAAISELTSGTVAKVLKFARDPEIPPGTALEILTERVKRDDPEASDESAGVGPNDADEVDAALANARPRATERDGANPSAQRSDAATPAIELPTQLTARRELDQALDWGRRRILVLGPVGSGKSTVVRAAADAKRGFVFGPSSAPRSVPEDWLIALDDAQPTTEEGWKRATSLWERHGGAAVLTLRGRAPESTATVLTEDARVSLPSTQAIIAATDGVLPVEIAEKVDAVIVLDPLDEDALKTLATALLTARSHAEGFVSEAAPQLAKAASGSGRGAHELAALVQRIPPGAWKFESPEPPAPTKPAGSKRRGKRKGDAT